MKIGEKKMNVRKNFLRHKLEEIFTFYVGKKMPQGGSRG